MVMTCHIWMEVNILSLHMHRSPSSNDAAVILFIMEESKLCWKHVLKQTTELWHLQPEYVLLKRKFHKL